MNRLYNVHRLAEDFYTKQKTVIIDYNAINNLNLAKNASEITPVDSTLLPFNTFLFYTVLNAINYCYCYWQGTFNFRPNNMDSFKTMALLLKHFKNHNNNTGYKRL